MKIYQVNQDGVIYMISGNNEQEAIQCLVDHEMQCNGELSMTVEELEVTEMTKPFKITYADEGVEMLSTELVLKYPEIICCTEW